MAYSNLDGFSVEGPAPARIAPKHVMKGGVYIISSGLFTARDTHAIASMCLQRGLRRRLAVEDLMESVLAINISSGAVAWVNCHSSLTGGWTSQQPLATDGNICANIGFHD